ncbi:major facilitator superfamily domain-containing protein [Aspergillus taichungensis]|uniref:Major facilitator superfamily domain-containing protein n=1 Tax=Aspergillus taichungensis TaxID=482145 RepID=A0A2J5HQI6_9EURO|nr:major facilitator superfamily domain-containing protein [Aspergillus taichungensis]
MPLWFLPSSSRKGNNKELESDSHPLLDQPTDRSLSIDERPPEEPEKKHDTASNHPVTWLSLPNKTQLFILLVVRFSEVAYRSSTRTYRFHQLRWFDPVVPDHTLTTQAGIVHGSSTAVQIFSGILVGRLADTPWIGRKPMLLCGLFGYVISSVGLAFSKSFLAVVVFQVVGAVMDGVPALARTTIAETMGEKKHMSCALVLLSLSANMGGTLGPFMGGVLADPVHNYPSLFGKDSILGGVDGIQWMSRWPYALPNLVTAGMCTLIAVMVVLCLDEVCPLCPKAIALSLFRRPKSHQYQPVGESPPIDRVEDGPIEDSRRPQSPQPQKSAGFRILLERNVLLTLSSRFLFSFHDVTYTSLLALFLPTPRASPFVHHGAYFGGGMGLPTADTGLAMSISGAILIPLSLALYPTASARLGILRSYRIFLSLALIVYIVTPFLVFVPDQALPVWLALGAAMTLLGISRTFTCPASGIILNYCISDPSARATVNGLGQSVTSAAKTIGPVIGSWGLGMGLKSNLVGVPWWGLGMAVLTQWIVLYHLKDVD